MIAPIPSRHPQSVAQLGPTLDQMIPNVEHMFGFRWKVSCGSADQTAVMWTGM